MYGRVTSVYLTDLDRLGADRQPIIWLLHDEMAPIEPVLQDIYNLEPERSQDPENQFRIAQIKEKFASLRVYIDIPSFWRTEYPQIYEVIKEAKSLIENHK